MRKEHDKIGELELNDSELYGIHTKRALINFPVSNRTVNEHLINAMIEVKKAAILTFLDLGMMEQEKGTYILKACDTLLGGEYKNQFTTDALQGGAGTSTNMNVNEVIANCALLIGGRKPGEYDYISPLDDVNKSQSTNDVYPTALRIAAIRLVRRLSDSAAQLQESLQKKELEFESVIKLGRTQLMDALPITLGQEFGAYAQAIARDRWRIYKVEERLRQVNLSGTAVGVGNNAERRYSYKVIDTLRDITGLGLARAEYPMDLTQNNDVFVEVSGLLKALAVNLMKISNDLRLMNSGPNGGFGEITLAPMQAGSSIMPGKVNPVIPEMVAQVAMKVIANDTAITFAASSGQLELNAFLPLIADSLLESLELLIHATDLFRTKCIETLKANEDRCKMHLNAGALLVTALVPYLGYDVATSLYTEAGGDNARIHELVLQRGLLPKELLAQLFDCIPLQP